MDKKGGFLFDEEDVIFWKKEWQDMPEFIQNDLTPFRTILVHFQTQEDVDMFTRLMEQKISAKTRFIWFPKVRWKRRVKHYVDE